MSGIGLLTSGLPPTPGVTSAMSDRPILTHLRHSARDALCPKANQKKISTSEMPVSQLNTQLMVSPVNASRQPSRTAAHHSGPERLARPYSAVDFHLLSFASLSWRSPNLARFGSPAAQNRLLLYPRKQTFSWPSLTSGCDPQRKSRAVNPASVSRCISNDSNLARVSLIPREFPDQDRSSGSRYSLRLW